MTAQIINYGIRLMIVVIGILLLSGVLSSPEWDISFIRVMGIVFILFGIYRIIIYHSQLKRYSIDKDNDDETN